MDTTTIQIDVEVRDQLRSRGRMGESYNDVILRLLTATRSMSDSRPEVRDATPMVARPWAPLQNRD
jgi:predicted CopG family antitoxin